MLVPLLMLLLGVVEFGRLYSQQLSMQYAAREAARIVALKHDDPDMTPALLDLLVDDQLVDTLPTVDDVADLADTIAVTIDPCETSGGLVEDTTRVQLTQNVDLNMPFVDLSDLETITATAEMPCES